MKTQKLVIIYILTLAASALLVGLSWSMNQKILNASAIEIARVKGQSAFQLLQTIRSWSARHGGAYVPVTENSRPNPYLHTDDRDIVDSSGRRLTKINPAYMTRQISELLQGGDIEAGMTSLRPINPINKPTEWERQAMIKFETQHLSELVELIDDRYRYIAPLYVEPACLKCHTQQGYKVGDVRGAMHINFPTSQIDVLVDKQKQMSNRAHLIAFVAITLTGLLMIPLVMHLLKRIQQGSEQREELERRARYDQLTGVLNRSNVLEYLHNEFQQAARQQQPFSLIMVDLDYFKTINDTYGHRAGDKVLRCTAEMIHSQLRENDQIGRYGGEEFCILLPDTNLDSALAVAERIRSLIEHSEISTRLHPSIRTTVSVGVAELSQSDCSDSKMLIELADQALYLAKNRGRNRVCSQLDLKTN
ncbi:diguanylate cyclase [Motiliproteus coralliicola]|uniref:diguanylate cyclase n=1 Tax=Motiliproteus coralliicola TaxID=2283196 RepID=A0A369WC23_9GAMM|nr:diguanylate cyclase [Motiliproteus coralliicola]RDE19570.1 diguanylate cyclase [Motiliproteus coralliicola]